MARALMLESKVPKSFWPEAINTAVYLFNRLPTKALDLKTPLDTLSTFTKLPPPLTLPPRVFGCIVFSHIPKTERSKLDPCAEKCVFVGYGVNQKGYRCYNPSRRRVITTVHCDFLETKYYYQAHLSGQGEIEHEDSLSWLKWIPSASEDESSHTSTHTKLVESLTQESSRLVFEVSDSPNLGNVPESDPNTTNNQESPETMEQVEIAEQNKAVQREVESNEQHDEGSGTTPGTYVLPPRANRGVPPKRYSPERETRNSRYPTSNMVDGNLSNSAKAFVNSLYSEQIPTSVKEAQGKKNWKEAMETEMRALMKKQHVGEVCSS
ncbi:putative RNA-directed DNA polymerase [Helianthus annuus]|nr:putative RNA-directed DNA polymerase [Helianthus annuus]